MVLGEMVVDQSRKLMSDSSRYVAKMPPPHKLTHGDRIISRSILLLECVVEAYNSVSSDKPALIKQANTHLDKLREIIQGCSEDGVYDLSDHEHLNREIDSVGRTLGGWSKSLSSHDNL
jgi:hypothetical protein